MGVCCLCGSMLRRSVSFFKFLRCNTERHQNEYVMSCVESMSLGSNFRVSYDVQEEGLHSDVILHCAV